MQYVPEKISHDGHDLQIDDEPDEGDEEENEWNKKKEVGNSCSERISWTLLNTTQEYNDISELHDNIS